MSETREMPEGVTEEMVACPFCGQFQQIHNVSLNDEQLREAAIDLCSCKEAVSYKEKKNIEERAEKEITRMFPEEDWEFIKYQTECLLYNDLKKISLEYDSGMKVEIKLTPKGNVKITKKKLNTAEVTI